MLRTGWIRAGLAPALCLGVLLAACSSSSTPAAKTSVTVPTYPPVTANPALLTGGTEGGPGYLVYWDQNEEEDFYSEPSGTKGQLTPPWDPNGQMCVLPNGQFVVGYDPTLPAQHNLGGVKPYKQPADGEELDEPNGAFSGQDLYVPGPYKMPGQSIGSDSPPTANGIFNNNQTYTGCAVGAHNNVFGADISSSQGNFPALTSGRLIEWFAPKYTSYCIVYGPTAGGVGPHHDTGTGGLANPGTMAIGPDDNLLVPNVGTDSVLSFANSSLPTSAAQCPDGVYPRSKVHVTTFFKGNGASIPFPAKGIAEDPTCSCYAISTYFGNPSIIWVTANGTPEPGRGSLPGTLVTNPVVDEKGNTSYYTPFGLAFAPDGTLYFVDIHNSCTSGLVGCGPNGYTGRVMKVTFTNGQPNTPVAIAGGFDFPTSVTVCVPAHTLCPYPTGRAITPPLSGPTENPAPDAGPPTNTPATAGFG